MPDECISQLTLNELRKECEARDLASTGNETDVELRFAEYL